MTAVQGIEMLPLKESAPDSSVEVKKKGEPSPFDRLLAKEEASGEKDGSVRKDEGPARMVKPARAEEPVLPQSYSLKKIAALLQAAREEGLVDPQAKPDLSPLKEKKLRVSLETVSPEGSVRKNLIVFPGAENRGEEKELISRFFKGELTIEELEELIAPENEGAGAEILASPAKDKGGIPPEEGKSGDGGQLLKGFLSEEGELVYFEEVPEAERALSPDKAKKTALSGVEGKSNQARIEINVSDLRTGASDPNGAAAAALQEKFALVKENSGGKGEVDLADDLLSGPAEKLFSAEGSGGRFEAPVTKEVSRLFRDYMNETGNKELVRKIDFILKNDNQGEIKLILKPEALGNVRINLSLNENNIAGKIIVDNSSVRDIFLNNMDQLTSLLKDNGYDTASLEVWVGQDGRDGKEQGQDGDREEEKRLRSVKGLERLEESVPQTAYADGSDMGQVNLVI